MRFGTSCFNWPAFKKTCLRFAPLWIGYFVFWFIVLPLKGLQAIQLDAVHEWGEAFENFAVYTVPGRVWLGLGTAVVFAPLCAMAAFSHLYSAKSANFFGALPVRREGLFVTHYLAGLSFTLLPNLVIALLTMAVELAGGMAQELPGLWYWLGMVCGECFFFYSLSVFCGMFTGHRLALPLFYAVANGLAMGLYAMVEAVLSMFYYGFAGLDGGPLQTAIWLTPIANIMAAGWSAAVAVDPAGGLHEPGTVGVYTLAGLVMAACSLLLYRARRLESAGDVIAVRPMRPVFKYGVSLCSGMFLGVGTTAILSGDEPMLMVSIVLWGVIGYFIAQMLLEKSFRVFGRWRGAAVMTGLFAAVFLVVGFDLTGFETRVPDLSQVAEVTLSGLNSAPYDSAGYLDAITVDDPEVLADVVALHQAMVDRKGEAVDGIRAYFTVTYTLRDGRTLTRSYSDLPTEEGEPSRLAEQLINRRALLWESYNFDRLLALQEKGRLCTVTYSDDNTNEDYYRDEHIQALLDAVLLDFEAGAIGTRSFGYSKGAYQPTLSFFWEDTPDSSSVDGPADSRILFRVEIAVPDTAVHTLAVLAALRSG